MNGLETLSFYHAGMLGAIPNACSSLKRIDRRLCKMQGDTCNLIGCLLTGNQLQTQVYTAM